MDIKLSKKELAEFGIKETELEYISTFLRSTSGTALLDYLQSKSPVPVRDHSGRSTVVALQDAGLACGWQGALAHISALRRRSFESETTLVDHAAVVTQAQSTLPDLDDPRAWPEHMTRDDDETLGAAPGIDYDPLNLPYPPSHED